MADRSSARNAAMDLLSRREHSRAELLSKLKQRQFDDSDIETALQRLCADNLQSDQRYAQSYVRQRSLKYVGPIRIRHELKERGIAAELIETVFNELDKDWEQAMRELRSRKFGEQMPEDFKEKMKQARFLQNKGFSPESVMRLFR